MSSVLTLLPFLISLILGWMLCDLCLKNVKNRDPYLDVFLAGGIGLGASSFLMFLAVILKNRFDQTAVLILHVLALAVLVFLIYRRKRPPAARTGFDLTRAAGMVTLLIFAWPVWIFAKFYPFGGWDAWAVWNFKAKFILLSGTRWNELFLPELWRSSPHYPLLLPMTNVWLWSFLKTPLQSVPMILGVVFTMLSAGVLMFSLMEGRKRILALAAPVLMLSLPHFLTLATNQYADIVLGYYLLGAAVCLRRWLSLKEDGWGYLAALFLGCLAFTKPEGLISAGILTFSALTLTKTFKNLRKEKHSVGIFLGILVAALLPALLFKFLYSPGNQSFINGLLSAEKPSTFSRLRFILTFYAAEWLSGKWNGFWWLISAGMLLGIRKTFHKQNLLIPLFLLSYLAVITLYYWANTYFEIQWWMKVTLSRLITALVPLSIFWIFSSIIPEDKKQG